MNFLFLTHRKQMKVGNCSFTKFKSKIPRRSEFLSREFFVSVNQKVPWPFVPNLLLVLRTTLKGYTPRSWDEITFGFTNCSLPVKQELSKNFNKIKYRLLWLRISPFYRTGPGGSIICRMMVDTTLNVIYIKKIKGRSRELTLTP